MPLSQRAQKNWQTFSVPVSFRVSEGRKRLKDASNVFSNQGRLETRNGMSRYNTIGLGGKIISSSFFKKTDGTKILIAKVGDTLYRVSQTGSHTSIKTGLSVETKHRGITLNNRHVISIEEDGLFSYDGAVFSQLGQSIPTAPTLSATAGGLTDSEYEVAITFYASGIGFETNRSSDSNNITTTSQGLSLTAIPTTADNGFIDKVRVYR